MGPCRGLRAKFNGVVEEADGTDCGDESGGDPRSGAARVRCHTILASAMVWRALYDRVETAGKTQRME